MNIVIVKDYSELSLYAAELVAEEIKNKAGTILGLATGSTPEGLYAELVKRFEKRELDFSTVTTFNLDEYYSLEKGHPQSYHHYMHQHLFGKVNIKEENIHIPSGCAPDPCLECREYDQKIKEAGGIDLQVLGLGSNGHIGFNEPAVRLNVGTHLVELTAETIEANSRFFSSKEEVPRRALTMGVGSIMQARQIILLASGKGKAPAIKNTVSGLITTAVPSSLLQLHRNITIIVDQPAASMIV